MQENQLYIQPLDPKESESDFSVNHICSDRAEVASADQSISGFLLVKQRNSWHLAVTFLWTQTVPCVSLWNLLSSYTDLLWPAVLCPLQKGLLVTQSTPPCLKCWVVSQEYTETAGSRPGCDTGTSVPHHSVHYFYPDTNCTLDKVRSMALLPRTDDSACSMCSLPVDPSSFMAVINLIWHQTQMRVFRLGLRFTTVRVPSCEHTLITTAEHRARAF